MNAISPLPQRFSAILVLLLLSVPLMAQRKKTKTRPDPAISKAIEEAYAAAKDIREGNNANYIPALAEVDPSLFGLVVITTDGQVYSMGNVNERFSIQSISKVFTLARVIDQKGSAIILDSIGTDATGDVFNSIHAVERMQGREINPFVNPGAIAATSLIRGRTYEAKWNTILETHSDFAGEALQINIPVYESEAATNQRNQAIAHLLLAYGRMYWDPVQTTDVYTKQCAINVNALNLAQMAATLANGGKNPVTGKVVVSPESAAKTLAVMATAGLYDDAGIWLYKTGLPAKSGVGGGIIAVCPGKFGIAAFAPPLDAAGNSVKAQVAIAKVVELLQANPYLIQPK
jgi:glutaminase